MILLSSLFFQNQNKALLITQMKYPFQSLQNHKENKRNIQKTKQTTSKHTHKQMIVRGSNNANRDEKKRRKR